MAAGKSQAALGSESGVSRQTIGAIEAGRHRPGVDAALAIARAVGRPVEELFGTIQPPVAEPILGRAVPDGTAVLASRVGDRLVYAPVTAALAAQGWPLPDGILHEGMPRALPATDLVGLVVLGCDPALGSLASMLPASGPRRLLAISSSTRAGLEAMAAGRSHAALVHGRPGHLPAPPRGALRLHLAGWRVGLASARSRPRSVADLCGGGAQVIQRERGASSQDALLSAVEAAGLRRLDGPVASGHVEVAQRVAGGAPAGVTMEPAASAYGLAFTPLEDHVAEIWVDRRWREHPGVDALVDALRSNRLTARLGALDGYAVAGCGDVKGTHA